MTDREPTGQGDHEPTGLKRYRSHKVVQAGVIDEIGEGGVRVGDEWIGVPEGIFARGTPKVGADYLVLYPDGYISWSPKRVFDDGYTEIP